MATFTGHPNTNDNFVGGVGADTFLFATADLNALDTVTGGGGADLLQLTTAGVLAANALAGVSGVQTITLAAGTNGITLVNANFTGVSGGLINVYGSSGDDTINASGVTGASAVTFRSGAGLDVLRGGAGADTFRFSVADLAGDTVQGGGGNDLLQMTTAGTFAGNALSAMTGVELIGLAAGTNSVTLVTGNFIGLTGGKITMFGASGADTIDASGVTGANVVDFRSGAGLDVLNGGAGNDIFRFAAADIAGDTVQGGGGDDQLLLSTAGALAANALSNVTAVESILLAAGGNSVALANGNFTGVNGAKIVVYGGAGNDTVDASGVTGTNSLSFSPGAGLDVLKGSAGADIFRFAAANLAGDTVQGGGGSDQLQLATSGVLAANALANVTSVETIVLSVGTNSITLVDTNFTGVVGAKITVYGDSGADTIDASGLTGANAVVFNSRTGLDVLKGGAGADTFRFAAADLAGDTVQGGGGSDLLQMTTAGLLAANALANMTGVETIGLAPGTNSVTLVDGNFAGGVGKITVYGSSGADTIDGSGVAGANTLDFRSGSGLDVLKGGAGSNTFNFAAVDLAGDTIKGGSGSDFLQLTTAGALAANALANMTGVETIKLANGGNVITLTDSNLTDVVDGAINVYGGSGNDTMDGSAVTIDKTLLLYAGAGLDTLKGGAGNDIFLFDAANLAGDTISGNGGLGDFLLLQTTGALAANALSQMTGVEGIRLSSGGNSVTLVDGNYTGVVGGYLKVFGGNGNDTIDASGLAAANAATFSSGSGLDTLKGGAGNDFFNFSAANLAGDSIAGGAGNDALFLTTAGVLAPDALGNMIGVETINVAAGGNTITLTDANYAPNPAGLSVINVVGSAGASTIDGSALNSAHGMSFFDRDGADTLFGGSGSDMLSYTFGFRPVVGDTFDGGGGNDIIYFDQAMDFLGDTITNVEELEFAKSSPGTGSVATVNVSGENAARLKFVGSALPDGDTGIFNVRLSAGSTTDLSNLALHAADLGDAINVFSASGNTTVTLSSSIASFTGSVDSDTVGYAVGGHYMNGAIINGGGGDDRIAYDPGSSAIIDGDLGSDTLVLRGGAVVNLTATSDQIHASPGQVRNFENVDATASGIAVTIKGRDDLSSVLIGGSGGDTITAGQGGATITGGLGADTLVGDLGNDRFHLRSTAEATGDSINGGGGSNGIDLLGSVNLTGTTFINISTLYLAASDVAGNTTGDNVTATVTGAQAGALLSIFGNGNFTGSVETLVVNATTSALNLSNLAFYSWSGADHVEVNGTSANDTITGSSTGDVIHGGGGADTLSGGGGNDTLGYDASRTIALDGGADSDTVKLESNAVSGLASIAVDLAAGTITEIGTGGGQATIASTNFENADFSQSVLQATIKGTSFDNILIGGSNADTITGGLGADRLTGNGGADSFVWNSKLEGGDTITDFTSGVDDLAFKASAFTFSGSTFDTVSVDGGTTGLGLNFTDLFITSQVLNSAAAVRSFVSTQNSVVSHGMFVIAANAQGHEILYYSDDASKYLDTGFDTAFYQIADLGNGPFSASALNDFVFI